MLEDGGVIQGWRHRGCLCWCEDSLRLWFGLRYQKHSFADFTHLPSEKSIKPLNPDIQRVKLRKIFLLKASRLIYTVLIVPLYSSISLPAFICQLLFASTKLCHHQSVQQPHRAVITCRWLSADMKHRRAEIFRQKRTKWRRLKCRSICNKTHLRSQSSASLCTNLFLLGGDSNYT